MMTRLFKSGFAIMIVALSLSACGQSQYGIDTSKQSALVDPGNHIEGDINYGGEEYPEPVSSASPSESPSPSPSSNPLYCGKNKVYICHYPPGNPANAHTLCVSEQGALHGHGVALDGSGGLTDDHLGKCSENDEVIESDHCAQGSHGNSKK